MRGSTSLVVALLAETTQIGSWAATAGLPDLGLAAAAELGVDLDQIALVSEPGVELVAVLSALVDGFDLVVLRLVSARGDQPQLAQRQAGRLRTRGTVLITVEPGPAPRSSCACPATRGAVPPAMATVISRPATLWAPAVAAPPPPGRGRQPRTGCGGRVNAG